MVRISHKEFLSRLKSSQIWSHELNRTWIMEGGPAFSHGSARPNSYLLDIVLSRVADCPKSSIFNNFRTNHKSEIPSCHQFQVFTNKSKFLNSKSFIFENKSSEWQNVWKFWKNCLLYICYCLMTSLPLIWNVFSKYYLGISFPMNYHTYTQSSWHVFQKKMTT